MPSNSIQENEPLPSFNGRLGSIRKNVQSSLLGFYGKSSNTNADDASTTNEAPQYRGSGIFRAFAYDDYPDPHVESARTTTITKGPVVVKTIGTPPKRPPRPDSWMRHNSDGYTWANVSLNGSPTTEKRIEMIDAPNTSKSAAPSLYMSNSMSGTLEETQSSNHSLEKSPGYPPGPVGFWHTSLKKERRRALGRYTLMTILLSIFILGCFSLYWAVVTMVDKNMSAITVFVVNFETQSDALVGSVVTDVTESIVRQNQSPRLGFVTIPPISFNSDPLAIREAVWEGKAWAAIVVNSNATQLLRQAIGLGNTSYDPNGAIQILYNEAREQDLYANHIYPMMQKVQAQILHQFAHKWTAEVMSNGAIPKTNMALVPQAINPGIGFSTFNIRPFLPHTAIPAVSLGLIYLIIISFFSFSFYQPIHMKFMKGNGHTRIKFWQFILWRWLATMIAYFILSLAYSLISVAFGFPFGNTPDSNLFPETNSSNFYNYTFLIYWCINFCGMVALGLACENVEMILGMPWTALWLIFWMITNVATAFYAVQLDTSFYRWGYVWPLHNIVEASRTILFDLHSNLPVNFGVLITWGALNTAVFPFACWFLKWKLIRKVRRFQQLQEQQQQQ